VQHTKVEKDTEDKKKEKRMGQEEGLRE